MKKYFAIIRVGIQDALEYRSEALIHMLGWAVRLTISILIFAAVFKEHSQIGEYNFQDIVLYFIVMQILSALNFVYVGFFISNDIQNGDFSNYMLKPVSYIIYYWLNEFSRNIVRFSIALLSFGIILLIYRPSFFNLELLKNLPIIIPSMLLAYSINALMAIGIGLLSFWIVNARRILFMFYAILTIFSGMMIPITLFPEKFQKILFWTPFPYVIHVPGQIILGKHTSKETIVMLTVQLVWVAVIFIIVQMIHHFGIKKYEAVGR